MQDSSRRSFTQLANVLPTQAFPNQCPYLLTGGPHAGSERETASGELGDETSAVQCTEECAGALLNLKPIGDPAVGAHSLCRNVLRYAPCAALSHTVGGAANSRQYHLRGAREGTETSRPQVAKPGASLCMRQKHGQGLCTCSTHTLPFLNKCVCSVRWERTSCERMRGSQRYCSHFQGEVLVASRSRCKAKVERWALACWPPRRCRRDAAIGRHSLPLTFAGGVRGERPPAQPLVCRAQSPLPPSCARR